MSPVHYESESYANPYIPAPAKSDPLRLEHGWRDVTSGLSRMLVGYLLILFCMGMAVLIVVSVALNGNSAAIGGPTNLTNVWIITGGGGLISLLMLLSYYLVLTGKWACAIYAPDRCGAKWAIFLCMISLLFGPIVGAALNFSAASSLLNNPESYLRQLAQQDQLYQVTFAELIGPAVSFTTTILFVLFVRQVGSCFENPFLSFAADLFLVYSAILAGVSGFLLFNPSYLQSIPIVAVILGLGWLASLVSYLSLIVFARFAIQHGMSSLQSPLRNP